MLISLRIVHVCDDFHSTRQPRRAGLPGPPMVIGTNSHSLTLAATGNTSPISVLSSSGFSVSALGFCPSDVVLVSCLRLLAATQSPFSITCREKAQNADPPTLHGIGSVSAKSV